MQTGVGSIGNYITDGLIRNASHNNITNIRGKGSFIAFDLPNQESRDAIMNNLYDKGVLVNRCGNRSIRIRPSLTLTPEEAELFLDGIKNLTRITKQ